MKYKAYSQKNFDKIPQVQQYLSQQEINEIKVVAQVLPFKANNYLTEELIDWPNHREDPIFNLVFPCREMLLEEHFSQVQSAMGGHAGELKELIRRIQYSLSPHPAGQMDKNVPSLEGSRLSGIQHKYDATTLFFPGNGQTCHAYCAFCFRWAQFVGINELKFGMKEVDLLINYLRANPQITDVLFTGGDPMIMSAKVLRSYIEPLINADLPGLSTIRIGTKALGFWPYKFTTDHDADETLKLFEEVVEKGYHLAFMGHFSHPVEMKTPVVEEAIRRIRKTGAEIRTQSPVMKHVNDSAEVWKEMWAEQVKQGCIPYYMFVARDTGAQDYFAVTLADSYRIFNEAYKSLSGLARTVRGPSMSSDLGKVQVCGVTEVQGEKLFVLNYIQARDDEMVGKPFFARYDEEATWINHLEPALGSEAFFPQAFTAATLLT